MQRSDAMTKLLEQLRTAEAAGTDLGTESFQSAVKAVLENRLATEQDLSRRFKVSTPTINRWQRISAPHPLMRKSVITGLIEVVESAIV